MPSPCCPASARILAATPHRLPPFALPGLYGPIRGLLYGAPALVPGALISPPGAGSWRAIGPRASLTGSEQPRTMGGRGEAPCFVWREACLWGYASGPGMWDRGAAVITWTCMGLPVLRELCKLSIVCMKGCVHSFIDSGTHSQRQSRFRTTENRGRFSTFDFRDVGFVANSVPQARPSDVLTTGDAFLCIDIT